MTAAKPETDYPFEEELEAGELQAREFPGGLISAENGFREVLDDVLADCKCVDFGMLKIVSKEARGNIGIAGGSTISGAHIPPTSEYGATALKKLLSITKGIYTFIPLTRLPVELKQSLDIPIFDLLVWRGQGMPTDFFPPLTVAVEVFAPTEAGAARDDSEKAPTMVWGEQVPVFKSTLSNLIPAVKITHETRQSVEIERIHIPTEQDLLEASGKHKAITPLTRETPPVPATSAGKEHQLEPPTAPGATALSSELDAIPTPKGLNHQGHARPGLSITAGSQVREADQTSSQRMKSVSLDQATSQRMRSVSPDQASSQRMQSLNPDQASSQRMHAATAEAEPGGQRAPVDTVPSLKNSASLNADKGHNYWLTGGMVAGFTMFFLLGHQVITLAISRQYFDTGLQALKSNENKNAIVAFTMSIQRQPDHAAAYLYRGIAETRSGQLEAALSDFNKVTTLDPNNPQASLGRASARIKTGDFDSAIADCDDTLTKRPDYLEGYSLRALAFAKSGRYKEAIDDATHYLDNCKTANISERADAFSTRGFALFKLKELDQAVADFTKAIELNPKSGSLYASRAVAYKDLHDWTHAEEDADQALKLDPTDTSVFTLRGTCFRAQGDFKQALKELDRAVSLTPTPAIYKMRGEARLAVGDYAGAMKDLDYVLSITPDDKETKVLYNKARLGLKEAPVQASRIVADKVTSATTSPEHVDLTGSSFQLANRGYELLKKGSKSEACELLEAAVKADPKNANARRYLAYALSETGDDEGAARQFTALQALGMLQPPDKAASDKVMQRLHKRARNP